METKEKDFLMVALLQCVNPNIRHCSFMGKSPNNISFRKLYEDGYLVVFKGVIHIINEFGVGIASEDLTDFSRGCYLGEPCKDIIINN